MDADTEDGHGYGHGNKRCSSGFNHVIRIQVHVLQWDNLYGNFLGSQREGIIQRQHTLIFHKTTP